MNELLDDIPYGIILCNEVGGMLYINSSASKLFNCNRTDINDYNILSFIDDIFVDELSILLSSIKSTDPLSFVFLQLKDQPDKFYKLVAKPSSSSPGNIVLMIYDYTPLKRQHDEMENAYNRINENLIKNSLVLKAISHICNNVLYKNRSDLVDIIEEIAIAFHLVKAAICFRNGTGHIVYADRNTDNSYQVGRMDGVEIKENCQIWKNEINFINSPKLIFKVSSIDIDCNRLTQKNTCVNILKLKLNSQKVVGFFEFVEDDQFKLSSAELEILESLSQLLAYIVNNKEQVFETTNYIKEKFRMLTQPV